MRIRTPLVSVVLLALWAAGAIHAQVTNPIPAPVEKRGLMVEISDVVRLPDTRGLRPADQDVSPAGWARVSYVRDLPDGRRFANDSRGLLYLLDGSNQPAVYADVAAVFPFVVYNRLESGSSGLPSTRNSRGTACSTRCTANARWVTPRRRTSSRRDSPRRM